MVIDRIRQQKKLALDDFDNDQNLRRKILQQKPDHHYLRYLRLIPIWWETAIILSAYIQIWVDLLYLYLLAKTASNPCWRKRKQSIGNGHDTTRNVQKVRRSDTEVSNFIPYIAELSAIIQGSTIWSTINVSAFDVLHLLVHWMELI